MTLKRIGYGEYIEKPIDMYYFATASCEVYLVAAINPDELIANQYQMNTFDEGYDPDNPIYDDYVSDMISEEEEWHTVVKRRKGIFYFTRDELIEMINSTTIRKTLFGNIQGDVSDFFDDISDVQLGLLMDEILPSLLRMKWKTTITNNTTTSRTHIKKTNYNTTT